VHHPDGSGGQARLSVGEIVHLGGQPSTRWCSSLRRKTDFTRSGERQQADFGTDDLQTSARTVRFKVVPVRETLRDDIVVFRELTSRAAGGREEIAKRTAADILSHPRNETAEFDGERQGKIKHD